MSQHWGPPPPPPGDPWGGAAQHWPASQSDQPDHRRTVLGPSGGSSWQESRTGAWPLVEPPRLWPTVLVTVFLGLFGLIPASMAAGRARDIGAPTGPYWRAFDVIFGAQLIVQAVVLVFVVAPLRGVTVFDGARPTSVAYDDSAATSTRPPSTMLPVTGAPATQAPVPQEPAANEPVPTSQPDTVPPRAGGQPSTRTITSLPSGSWITVLDSMPKSQRGEQEAWAMADGLTGPARVVVLDSDWIPGLNAGYWAISITGSSSRNEANGWCSVMNRPVGGTCYPRQVS